MVKGDLRLGVGSTVNGVDVVALNRTVLTLHGDQTINGPMVRKAPSLVHVGSLAVLWFCLRIFVV